MIAKSLGTLISASLVFNCSAQEPFYIVKKGDKLSDILHRFNLKPIYGPRGSLAEILKANPNKKPTKGNQIYPGEIIQFSPAQAQFLSQSKIEPPMDLHAGPAAQPEPEPETEKLTKIKPTEPPSESFSEFTIRFYESFLKINGDDSSNDSSGALISKASPALGLTWSLYLNKKIGLDFGLKYQKVEFSDSKTKNLSSENQNLNSFFVGATYNFTPRWSGVVQAGQSEEIFYRAINTETIKIEKAPVPYMQLGTRYNIGQTQNMSYAVKASYRMHLPFETDHYDGSLAHGYQAGLLAEHRMGRFTLVSEGFYSQDIFPVDSVDFDRSEIGISLGLRYRPGEEARRE